jgi:hypothetical protein
MSDWLAEKKRAFGQGVTHSSARLGNAFTPPVVAWLIAVVTWRGSFIILGIVSVAWAVAWGWYFRDDPASHPAITSHELDELQGLCRQRKKGEKIRAMDELDLANAAGYSSIFLLRLDTVAILGLDTFFFFHSYGLKLQDSALLSAGGFFAGVVGNTAGGSCGKRARFEGSIVDGLKNKGAAHLDLLPEGRGILLVEFGSDDAARTEKIARKLIERLKLADPRPTTRLYTKTEARHGWHLREAGPRAAAFAPGAVAEWEGEIRLC